MVNVSAVRTKLANKIFNNTSGVGSTLTVTSLTSTTDAYGEDVYTDGTATTVYAVPFNYKSYYQTFTKWGELDVGEMDILVPYDTSIGRDYKITFQSTDYKVKDIEDYIIKDSILAKAVRLSEDM